MGVGTRISAVVVLHHPPSGVAGNIASYATGVDDVFALDNSTYPDTQLARELHEDHSIEYHHLGQNLGIAHALNAGARYATERGCTFLLTMDQDSVAPAGMVGDLLAIAEEDPSIGIIGPFHVDRNAPDPVADAVQEDVATLMTSGCLVNLEAYSKIGGFRDDYFIDYVDDEYCLRMQSHGYRVVRANRILLEHAQGDKTTKNFFGRTVRPTHHAPERFYYQSRNRIVLRRTHGRGFPEYFAYERSLHRGRLAKMFLYERDRLKKLIMVIRGMLDAWRGHMGPLSRG